MGLLYENLDDTTRALMLDELETNIVGGNLLQSNWLNLNGQAEWESLMRSSIVGGSDDSLAQNLQFNGRLNRTAQRRTPKGGVTSYTVPHTAAQTIAEGEFNRYYVRGVCRRAIAEGISQIEIYRGKSVAIPRPESAAKIGARLPASDVLRDLRCSVGLEPAFGLPPGPNSGLTARLPAHF